MTSVLWFNCFGMRISMLYLHLVCTLWSLYFNCSIFIHHCNGHRLLPLVFGSPLNGAPSTLPAPSCATGPGVSLKAGDPLFQIRPKCLCTQAWPRSRQTFRLLHGSYCRGPLTEKAGARATNAAIFPMVRRNLNPHLTYTHPILCLSLVACKLMPSPSLLLQLLGSCENVMHLPDCRPGAMHIALMSVASSTTD